MRHNAVTLRCKLSRVHGIAVALGIGLLAIPVPVQAQAQATVTVTISRTLTVQGNSSQFTWTVDPYDLVIAQGDTVQWIAVWSECESQPIIVVHKKGGWPFFNAPHNGSPTAQSGPMKNNAGGHYNYGITVVCPSLGAVVIDPDMDVE